MPSESERLSYEWTAAVNKMPRADCGGCQELRAQLAALQSQLEFERREKPLTERFGELLREVDPGIDHIDSAIAMAMDALRYRYIKAEFVQMHSPHMNGDHGWRFRHFRWSGNSFDAAMDKAMKEQPLKPQESPDGQ
jgi:hypothetical protein